MHFITAEPISRLGGRNYQEDYVGYQCQNSIWCWVLADGLGGHGGGDIASKTAVEAVLASFCAQPELSSDAVGAYISAAQLAILQVQQQQPNHQKMRSTLVLLLADQNNFICGHAGDSRLYHFNNGQLQFQTLDHSVPQALVRAGEIDSNEIRRHEDRNRLLQCLGNPDKLKPAIELQQKKLLPGDSFLLCSDGFWECILEAEMEVEYHKSKTPQEWLSRMESRMLMQQNPHEENDNYSALAIFTDWP